MVFYFMICEAARSDFLVAFICFFKEVLFEISLRAEKEIEAYKNWCRKRKKIKNTKANTKYINDMLRVQGL